MSMNGFYYNHHIPLLQRKRVYIRDGHSCVLCNCENKANLCIHHYFKKGDFDDEYVDIVEDEKLVTLCKQCHGKIHTIDKNSRLFQLLCDYMEESLDETKLRTD